MIPQEMPWPPLIVAQRSFWIGIRDLVLTTVMWLIFFLMIGGESNLLFGSITDQLGLRDDLEWLGFRDVSIRRDGPVFLRALVPYLGIALLLVLSLSSFAIDTIRRRREALLGPSAPALPPAVEARHAELSTMAGHVGEAVAAERADLDLDTVDLRSLLIAINRLDHAALADARKLRIVNVHLTEDGHYRIQAAA